MPLWIMIALWTLWTLWSVIEVVCMYQIIVDNEVRRKVGIPEHHYTQLASLVTTGWIVVTALWLSYNFFG